MEVTKVLVVLASACMVITVASVIKAAVSTKADGTQSRDNFMSITAVQEGKIYAIAMTGRKRPFSYIDDNGNLAGFDVDLATAACSEAGVRCQFEKRSSESCGTTGSDGSFIPGDDLLQGRVDMCASKGITEERLEYFDFVDPYYTSFTYFYVKKGNPRKFDENGVKGKVIGHLDGTFSDGDCLRKYGKGDATIVPIKGIDASLEAVEDETIDAFFAPRRDIPELQRLSDTKYECSLGGAAMVQKGSVVPQWWNPAFHTLVADGRFATLCSQVFERHNGNMTCYPEP